MYAKTRKLLSTMLALALVFSLFTVIPVTAGASFMTPAQRLAMLINLFDHGGDAGSTLYASASGNTVTVGGTVTNAKNTLELFINENETVIWRANYSGGESFTGGSDYLITLKGSGTFEVPAGGSVANKGSRGIVLRVEGDNTINVSGGTVDSSGQTTISSNTTNVTVNIIDGVVRNTLSGGSSAITANDNLTVNVSGGTVESTKGYAINSQKNSTVTVSNGTVRGVNAIAVGGAGGTSASVKITGGTVSSTTGYAIIATNASVTISGGTVNSTTAQAIQVASASVTISGGTVSSTTAQAIRALSSDSNVIVTGGFVFGCGTAVTGNDNNNVIWLANGSPSPTISGDAVVCAWDKPASGTPSYEEGSADRLTVEPAGKAMWGKDGTQNGIRYGTDGFYPISGITITAAAVAPTITGPATMSLQAGYTATSSAAFTVTGTPDPTVAKTSGNALITWNNSTKKLDIAAGLGAGTYLVELTATSGTNTATFTFTLTVTAANVAPTITGPATMSLQAGYTATSSTAFTVTGTPEPTVAKTSGNAAITWNNSTKKLDIAAGLAAGTYLIELTATSGTNTATFIFTLTVTAATTPPPSTGGSMLNFTQANRYTQGMFTDVNENAWYGFNDQKVIATAFEYDLMKGNTATTFNPTGNMSIAEAITVAARVHSIYMTGTAAFVQGAPWYQVYVDYAIANGIIETGDFTNYGRLITRAEMAYIFSRCLPISEFPSKNTVNSLPDVNNGTPYKNEIFMLYKAGVVQGSGAAGTFNPNSNIIRAEAAAIISRVIIPDARISGRTFNG